MLIILPRRIAIRSVSKSRGIIDLPKISSLNFIRGKATLPDLPYDYGALEPSISGKIMEIHHQNHHKTYVNNLNNLTEQLQTAISKQDFSTQISLQSLIKFNGGGHINHTLFWENLAPSKNGGGGEPTGKLQKAIEDSFTTYADFKSNFISALTSIQGSGWAWLVQHRQTRLLSILICANQDPVAISYAPLLGIDAWEHAYYLQYQNRKAEYFNSIWNVINWETVEKRLM